MNKSETYVITHYLDGDTEYIMVIDKATGTLQTASAAHTYGTDTSGNFWWGAGNTSSPTSEHTWRGKLGFGVYYAGTDYQTAETYGMLKFSFDTPTISIEGGRIIKRSSTVDDNDEGGYMELETSGTESYNRKRVGRYIGPTIANLATTEIFSSRTFTASDKDYKILKLPVHLTL